MTPNQALDLSSMCLAGLIGLIAGGIASYIANLLLYEEGFVASAQMGCRHKDSIFDAIPFISFGDLIKNVIVVRAELYGNIPWLKLLQQ